MIGDAGVLNWGSPNPKGWAPRGLGNVSLTNQAPTAVPANRPPVPKRGRSVPSKDPAPTDRDPALRCSQGPAETTFQAGEERTRSSRLDTSPFYTWIRHPLPKPRSFTTSAAIRT